ncbi:MAG: hypothetical protein M1282_17495 [Chloroflexi bacterium]|nr:hypothetical protein [Chloroflexota bacterium]
MIVTTDPASNLADVFEQEIGLLPLHPPLRLVHRRRKFFPPDVIFARP